MTEAEFDKVRAVEKVPVSPEWTQDERLAAIGVIVLQLKDLKKQPEYSSLMNKGLKLIDLLTYADSEFLENNRGSFNEYVQTKEGGTGESN